MRWLWYFIIYSFCGFLLEVAFARAIHHPKRDRKCLLLLPLCPVYGLGACLILWLVPMVRSPLWVALAGGPGAGVCRPPTGADLHRPAPRLAGTARSHPAGGGRPRLQRRPAPDGYYRGSALVCAGPKTAAHGI